MRAIFGSFGNLVPLPCDSAKEESLLWERIPHTFSLDSHFQKDANLEREAKMDAGGSSPPTLSDFSQKAIQRAIRNEALSHPVTLYSGVATVLTVLSWATFGAPVFLWGRFGWRGLVRRQPHCQFLLQGPHPGRNLHQAA